MATATPKAKTAVRIKMRIKKGDTVQVISGNTLFPYTTLFRSRKSVV